MSRAKVAQGRRDVYKAVAELLRASQRDEKGWMAIDIATGKRRDVEAYEHVNAEVTRLIVEMEARAKVQNSKMRREIILSLARSRRIE